MTEDQIHQVRGIFLQFIDLTGRDPFRAECLPCSVCRIDRIPDLGEPSGNVDHLRLLLVTDRDDHVAVLRQPDTGPEKCLVQRLIKCLRDAQAFTGRLHLRAKRNIRIPDLLKGKDRHLDREIICLRLEPGRVAHVSDLFAQNDSCRKRNNRNPGHLADVGYRPRGSRVHLDDIHTIIPDDELNIHHADHVQILCQTPCIGLNDSLDFL